MFRRAVSSGVARLHQLRALRSALPGGFFRVQWPWCCCSTSPISMIAAAVITAPFVSDFSHRGFRGASGRGQKRGQAQIASTAMRKRHAKRSRLSFFLFLSFHFPTVCVHRARLR